MKESLLFYVVDEHTDCTKFCKRKGMKPYSFEKRICMPDNIMIEFVTQYSYNGYIYDVLNGMECYTDFEVTLVRIPNLSFEELLNVALFSKYLDERVGAMGMILKNNSIDFKRYLLAINNSDIEISGMERNLKQMLSYIDERLRSYRGHIKDFDIILELCEELIHKIRVNSKYTK